MPLDAPPEIALTVDQDWHLVLPGFSGAGYRWSADVVGTAGIVGIDVTTGPVPDGPPGTSAAEVLNVRGLAPGHVRVVLRLRRPWTPDVDLDHAEIAVDVRG